MGSRTWFKIYADRWLRGSLQDETLALRGAWASVLALAASGFYGEDGIIQLAPNCGMTDFQIAVILSVPLAEWVSVKQRLLATQRISVNENNVLHVINWAKYQSEYSRLKVYRSKVTQDSNTTKLQPKVTQESNKEIEIEIEKEKENREEPLREKSLFAEGGFGGGQAPAPKTAAPTPAAKRNLSKYTTFEQVKNDLALLEGLKHRYPKLDLDFELDRCEEYWRSSGRTLKSAKLAFQNWLAKASVIAAQVIPQAKGMADGERRETPGNRPAGAFADVE